MLVRLRLSPWPDRLLEKTCGGASLCLAFFLACLSFSRSIKTLIEGVVVVCISSAASPVLPPDRERMQRVGSGSGSEVEVNMNDQNRYELNSPSKAPVVRSEAAMVVVATCACLMILPSVWSEGKGTGNFRFRVCRYIVGMYIQCCSPTPQAFRYRQSLSCPRLLPLQRASASSTVPGCNL